MVVSSIHLSKISEDLSVVFAKFITLPITVRSAIHPENGTVEPIVLGFGDRRFGRPPTYMFAYNTWIDGGGLSVLKCFDKILFTAIICKTF